MAHVNHVLNLQNQQIMEEIVQLILVMINNHYHLMVHVKIAQNTNEHN